MGRFEELRDDTVEAWSSMQLDPDGSNPLPSDYEMGQINALVREYVEFEDGAE